MAVLDVVVTDVDVDAAGWRHALAAAVDACLADDRALLDDGQIAADLGVLAVVARRLEAASARLVAEQIRRRPRSVFDATRQLKRTLRLSGAAARRLADTATSLEGASADAVDALDAGAISAEHLRILHGAGASLSDEARAALLEFARLEDADAFKQRVIRAVQVEDADGGAARAARQHAAHTASWRVRGDGMHELRVTLAPDDASIVRGALQQVMDARWRAEHPERNQTRVERDPFGARLADAVVDLARGVRAAFAAAVAPRDVPTASDGCCSEDGCCGGNGQADRADHDHDGGMAPAWMGRASPPGSDALVVLLADVETLRDGLHEGSVHEDGWGTTLSPETLRRLACDAEILPIVMDGASVPLDAGRKRREPTPTQRAAVVARDRHCRFPGCRVRAAWCQVHHIVHWARGGSTNLDNLILACHEHHRALHEGGWNAVGPADRVQFTSPSGQPFAG